MKARRESVLVTDGDQRAALAVVRSLGRAGYSVHVCASHVPSLAGASRYAVTESRLADPLTAPDRYAEGIAERVSATRAALLLPITEASLLTLVPRRARLGGVSIPWPRADRVADICDKELVLKKAAALGIGVPQQRTLRAPLDLWSSKASQLSFPLVVKPARSVGGREGRRVRLGVSYAASPDELRRLVEGLPQEAFPLLLQQRIHGPGVGVFLLLWRGELLAVFAHRRLREKPPSGGVSVYRESVKATPELIARSRRLLDGFEWEGVAMVEYKVDKESGRPYLMEVNGRFWGSLQLAIDAGVDFPALLAAAALGRAGPPVHSYRAGVRSRWWWGDLDRLLALWRRTPEHLNLSADAPGRLQALRDFLILWRPGDRSEILRLTDPRPFLRESAHWFDRALRRCPTR